MINNLNMIGLCCEAIVIGETLEMYVWLLRMLADMVEEWQLSDLKIIFGDGFITKSLLQKLDIEQTCVLYGDHFHLMHRILCSKQNFGPTTFALIKDYVDAMISSNTKEEWDCGYNNARLLLANKPKDMSLLDKIYGDPIYYAGYYVRTLFLNLGRLGSTPAEENHSSNVRHMGKGAHWCIAEEVSHLMEKHQLSVLKFLILNWIGIFSILM